MIMSGSINRDDVRRNQHLLPAFPRTIERVLATLDDPDANLNLLVSLIERDPALIGQILEQANSVAVRTRPDMRICNMFTATSMIGLARIRRTVIATSMAGFLNDTLPPGLAGRFWEHSCAVGVCAQQLAIHCHHSGDMALIAGMLHDVGQLWLYRHEPDAFLAARDDCRINGCRIEEAERRQFGVDHTLIGAWLAESWDLPGPLRNAILHHHKPEQAASEPLVAVTHIAEVLSAALGLNGDDSRVTHLSTDACATLKLTWDESVTGLFGRIDAVSQSMAGFFRSQGPARRAENAVAGN
ncbi:MAG: HDOD domain-containing protein [Dechloromonas sp.]|nr:MAG: HDOD domain-containing protein [Dechloromonas sp.]